MNLQEELRSLSARGLRLHDDGGQLRVRGRKEVLTPDVQSLLTEHKSQILELLRRQPAPRSPALEPITPLTYSDEHTPLSFAQRRFWFLHKLEPATSVYHICGALEFRGLLQVDALERALAEIVRRHEALRTVFPEKDGSPFQQVLPFEPQELSTEDLRHLPSSQLEAQIGQHKDEVLHQPFDLEKGSLFRTRLLLLDPRRSLLLVSMHHVVADGTSMAIFARELGQLYRLSSQSLNAVLPQLTIQYRDFSRWQHSVLTDERLQSQIDYWKNRLDGSPPLTTFPADFTRPPTQSYRGAVERFEIDAELLDRVRHVGRQRDSTLFATLLAAYAVLLSKYSRQRELVIGTPVANRPREELETLIGLFANTAALRLDLSSAPTFYQLLEQTRTTLQGALECQDIPFEQLVTEIRPDRDPSYNPIFQTMVLLRKEPLRDLDMGDIDVVPADTGHTTAKFDMMLELEETPEGLKGVCEYASDLYRPETVRRMMAHFRTVLRGVADQPNQPVATIPMTTEEERLQVVHSWNETGRDYPSESTVHQLFEEQVGKTPDAVAVTMQSAEWTYQRLDQEAEGIAEALSDHGIQPDELVGICARRSLSLIAGLVGILKTGGAYVPLDPDYPDDRLRFMIGDTGVRAILVTGDLMPDLQELLESSKLENRPTLILLDGPRSGSHRNGGKPAAVGPMNLAYCLYTSGSTGRPKGTLIPHRGVVRLVKNTDFIDVSPDQVFLQFAPISFDLSTLEIWGPLLNGGRLVMMPPGTPSLEELGAAIRDNGVTTLWLIAGMFRLMVDEQIDDLGGLKQLIAGGDVLSVPHVCKMVQRHPHCRMINGYGPTENTTFSSCYEVPLDQLPQKSVLIGRPIANSRAYIVDENLQAVPIGVPGELLAGGDGLARGYLNRPDLTSERFIPNPLTGDPRDRVYRTGDLARYLPDGNIEFFGRLDQQTKIRGFRVEPGELESALNDHDLVRDAVAVVRQSQDNKKELVAYVVCHGDKVSGDQNDEAVGLLRTYLRDRLPEYIIPSAVTILDEFPLNANGKVDRAALPEPTGRANDAQFEAPGNQTEETLCLIWSQVLGVSRVGIRDNFFESGGDSIQSIQIVSRARQKGIDLSPRMMLRYQTVAELASAVASPLAKPMPAASSDGDTEWTPVQRWFQEMDLPQPHHFNQAVLLELDEALDAQQTRLAIEALVNQHPALRTCYLKEPHGWTRQTRPPAPWTAIETVNLRGAAENSIAEREADRAQASLDLASGAIVRALYFDTNPGMRARLLLVIHHLAVDGVSWRILLDDLTTACQQLQQGEAIRLAPGTSASQAWASRLARYAREEMLADEEKLWRSIRAVPPFARDIEGTGSGTGRSERHVTVELDARYTGMLLRDATSAYQTSAFELLVAALQGCFSRCTGAIQLYLHLEGHGREDLFPEIDLSRTVGWFTSLYPVLLHIGSKNADPATTITGVKETLRSVPNRGIGFGVLRYLGTQAQRSELEQVPKPPIAFNYLGQTDQVLPEDAPIRLTEGPLGRTRSPENPRAHLIEINALVRDGRLRVDWTFSESCHHRETIRHLASTYLDVLREFLDHCVNREGTSYSPSDFPLADIDQTSIDQVVDALPTGSLQEVLPLASTQQGILFHREADPDSDAYIIQLRMKIADPLDEAAFRQAWSLITARHSALRSGFVEDGDKNLHQVILNSVALPWTRLDWSGLDNEEQRERLEAYCREERRTGFDLASPPLFRLCLIETGSRTFEFVWTCHHVLIDGWSMANILDEVTRAYAQLLQGSAVGLVPVPGYESYLDWLSGRSIDPAREFWAGELQGFSSPTELRVELPSQQRAPQAGDHRDLRRELDRNATARLHRCGRSHRITLNTLFQAAWSLLLRQFSESDDILFGTTVSGRHSDLPGAEEMVGLFITTLPVRVRIDREQPVRSWVLDLQERQLERDLLSFMPLVDLAPLTDLPRGTPLFRHLLVFENYPIDASLRSEKTPFGIPELSVFDRTNYPLAVTINPGETIRIKISYDSSVYDAASVETIAQQLEHFLEEVVHNIDGQVHQIAALPVAERHKILETWNDTAKDYPLEKTLMDLFEEQARRTPDATALICEGERLTYGELDEKSNRLARRLRSMGAGLDTLIGVSMERSIEMVVGLYGILKADAAYVPIDPEYPDERVRFMLEDSGVSLLLTQSRFLPRFSSGQYRCLALDAESAQDETGQNLEREARPEHLAYMIYTSGSTGRPKGVLNNHLGICNRLLWMQEAYPLGASDRVLQKTPFSFDVSVWEFFWPLQVGAALVIARPKGHLDSRYLARCIREGRVTTLHFVPSMLQIFLGEESIKGCTSLKRIICSGEALPVGLANQCRDLLPAELHNLYGPTEAAVDVSSWACPTEILGNSVPIGRPIANTSLYILDPAMNPVPAGVPGELHIGGICLARGYHNRPELTDSKFIAHPFSPDPAARLYKTGDLTRYLPDGNIEYLGRIDDQVKIRGFRIEPGEIEHFLRGQPGVGDCVVHVIEDGEGDKGLVAYCVTADAEELNIEGLKNQMRHEFPAYMVPSVFMELSAIPLSPNGKVDRKALPRPGKTAEGGDRDVPLGEVEELVAEIWSDILGIEHPGRHDNFFDLGGHSLRLMRVHRRLEGRFGDSLPELIEMFQLPTIHAQALAIASRSKGASALQRIVRQPDRDTLPRAVGQDIAVIGMACRFPGAPDPEAFWRNLRDGVESVTFFSEEELIEAGVDAALLSDPRYVKANSIIPDADRFDAEFFNFNPREAQLLDPQHRVFLECSWETFERAGYDPVGYSGRVAVFAGCGANSYILNNLYPNRELIESVDDFQLLLANDKDYLSTRVSYKLNLNGPSLTVQTACSTSLVAIALACQSLNEGHCDMALAGGVTLRFPQISGYLHKEGMIFSSDGHCRAFDADADGVVGGSGAGTVLLKPLDDAIAEGDTILAVVKGSATNNDGADKVGYTAPSERGQARAIEQALTAAGVEPETIGYIETHGTGTSLGDPIELAALGRIHAGRPEGSCAIGSVKTNVGHLDAAAGIAGFLKTVLCLRHGQIPPSLHFSKPNPRIDFEKSPFRVNTELAEWPRPDQSPRRAGVSSFGIGGTNVHVILEEVPEKGNESDTRPCLPYVISARSPETLEEVRSQLSQYLVENPDVHHGDLAFTLALGRHPFAERSFATARTASELLSLLEDPSALQSAECPSIDRQVVFMFPGQGTQYAGMGRGPYEAEPVFREQLDLCAEILTPLIEQDLRDALFPSDTNGDQAEEALRQTRLTQPALFSVEYSLARLWMSWGVQPAAMIGHSIGEYVAACLAGVLSLEEALRIVSVRGRLIQQLPEGSMLAVPMTEEELAPHLDTELDLAVQNAPKALIVSGTDAAIRELQDRLEKRQIPNRPLRTSHAFHSRMMEPILDPFTRALSRIELHPPRIPFVSNLTGEWITTAQATDAAYWAKHLRRTVRFSDGLSLLLKEAHYTLLEVGPGKTLNALARANPAYKAEQPIFASLGREGQKQTDQESLQNTLGHLWLAGVPIDWAGFFAREHRRRIPLPTYPFQRNRYWIDPPATSTGAGAGLLRRPFNQWFWCPTWKQLRHGEAPRDLSNTCWLLFLDEFELGERIAERLESAGSRVATITAGDRFQQLGATRFAMKPGEPAGYHDLVVALQKQDFSPSDILHLWPLQTHDPQSVPEVDAVLNRGFYSLVHLVRALGAEAPSVRPRIHNATSNLFSVLGEPSGSAVSSTVLGPVEVIPKEYTGFKCRNIDLSMLPEEPPGEGALIEVLWNECSRDSNESVALRGSYRWSRVFDRVDLDAANGAPARIRQRGTYLVTGGLGGLGFVLSRHLAQTAQANLVLIGRTRLPDAEGAVGLTDSDRSKLDRLRELRACGTRVDYYAADIADLEQMKNVVQKAEEEHGNIQGVIHAAGVAGGGVIQQKDLDDCAGVLEPKVKGALVLEEIFRTRSVDFLLLCSSTTALLGEFGQVDYAAANIFLDSFASRDETAMPWTCSINWDTWKEIGMAAETDVPATLQEARSRLLGTGITSAEGIQVFDRILASDLSQVVVSTRDFQSRIERERESSPDALAIASEAVPSHERPDLSNEFQTPKTPTEKALAKIWESFLGIRSIGADDDFFELGGHSLLATQVISRIREEFKVDLPMPSFFNQPTLAGMADNVDTIRWASRQESITSPDVHEQREKFEL